MSLISITSKKRTDNTTIRHAKIAPQAKRMVARMAELDLAYEVETKRLTKLLRIARQKFRAPIVMRVRKRAL